MRLVARRRGGIRAVTAGFVFVGGSGFLLLAAGPRLLGPTSYTGLALAWTVSSLFGIGLAAPTEQFVTRGLNAGLVDAVRAPMKRLSSVAALLGLALLALAALGRHASHTTGVILGMALAVVGWVPVTWVRSRLAGAGDLIAYGAVLAAESVGRMLVICCAVVFRGLADWFLLLGVGLPLIFAAAVGMIFRCQATARSTAAISSAKQQAAFVLYAVGFQVCLNGAPLLLELRSGVGSPQLVGAFVSASTYFRIPTLLIGGILTKALVDLSHSWGESDNAAFETSARKGMRHTSVLVVGVVATLSATSPWLLPLFYGGHLDLPVSILIGLGLSTVAAMVAAMAVQPLLAAGRASQAATVWVGGAALTATILVASGKVGVWTAFGLVAGPLLTAIAALGLRRPLLTKIESAQ